MELLLGYFLASLEGQRIEVIIHRFHELKRPSHECFRAPLHLPQFLLNRSRICGLFRGLEFGHVYQDCAPFGVDVQPTQKTLQLLKDYDSVVHCFT